MATAKKAAAKPLKATPRRKATPAVAAEPAAKPALARMPPPPAPRAPRPAPMASTAPASSPRHGANANPAQRDAASDDDASGRSGHYGWRPVALAVLGVLALVLHLAVPYQVVFCDDDQLGCPDDKTANRSGVSDSADAFGDAWVASAGPGLTLAGAILLLVGGAALAVLGFVPMPVTAARWAGWLGGAVAFLGGWFVASTSFYWIGDWAVALLNLGNAGPPDFVLALSPLFVGAAGVAAVVLALAAMRDVVTTRDGLREEAGRSLGLARWSLLALGLTLLVPWSLQNPEGSGYLWHSAHSILLQNSVSDGFGGGFGAEQWTGMAYALTVLAVTAWIAAFVGVVVSAGGLLAGTPMPTRWLPLANGLSLFMLAWSAVLYVLMWAYMWKPGDGAQDYLPGFFPLLVLVGFVPLAMRALDHFRGGLGGVRSVLPASGTRAVRFD